MKRGLNSDGIFVSIPEVSEKVEVPKKEELPKKKKKKVVKKKEEELDL